MATKSDSIGEMFVDIRARMDKYEADLKKIQKKSEGAGENVKRGWKKTFKDIAKLAVPVAGLAQAFQILSRAVTQGFRDFRQFDKNMRNVNTILGVSQKELKGFSKELSGLSKSLGQDVNDLAGALYQAGSAGIQAGDAIKFVEVSAKSAVAGLSTTETAVDALTTVLNSYGWSADDAEKASDIMFKTVKLGKTTFDQLAGSLSNVLPIAQASGVSFEEVSAGIAQLTAQGVPTAQATTQIRSAIIALNDVLGDGWSEAYNMGEAMQFVRDSVGGSNTKLKELIGRQEGVNAILGLTGEKFEDWNRNLLSVNNNLGATTTAFEEVADGIDFKMSQLEQTWSSAWRTFSEVAIEALFYVDEASKTFAKNQGNYFTDAEGVARDYFGNIIKGADDATMATGRLAEAEAKRGGLVNLKEEIRLLEELRAKKEAQAQLEAELLAKRNAQTKISGIGEFNETERRLAQGQLDYKIELMAKEIQARRDTAETIQGINVKAVDLSNEEYDRLQAKAEFVGSTIERAFSSAMSGIYFNGKQLVVDLERMWSGMVNAFIGALAQMLAKWLTTQAIMALAGAPGLGFLAGLLKHGGKTYGKQHSVQKAQSGASFNVPGGFNNDSYPLMVESGERVEVTSRARTSNQEALLSQLIGRIDALNQNTVDSQQTQGAGGKMDVAVTGKISASTIKLANDKGNRQIQRYR